MPPVVTDTGPLNYLILIEAVRTLPRLFSAVLIPPGVREELSHAKAPSLVREWVAQPPAWLTIVNPESSSPSELASLVPAERQAIAIAVQEEAALLIDDREGVAEARRRGIAVIGTLAVLARAAQRGWVDLPEMFRRLRATSFRSPVHLMARMLEEDALRRK